MRREVLVFLVLGLVSLTADITYEGARSVSGAFLENLGAIPIAAAIVGSGELVSYLMRFVGGLIATAFRSSRVFWATIILGYTINLVAVPALAFAGRWDLAVALYLAERVGKGLRTPARDTVLAEVTSGIGKGKGFGIHEIMDQAGAVTGPLIVSWGILHGGYSIAFLSLAIPAAVSILLVCLAAALYPKVKSVSEGPRIGVTVRGLPKRFWLYTLSMSLLLAGYAQWSIVSFYMASTALTPAEIGLVYSLAMLVDALVALPVGMAYDRYGLMSLVVAPPLVAAIPTLLLSGTKYAHYFVGALWGLVMGMYETNMRAAVADVVDPQSRAMAYGTFGMVTGLAWTVGGFIISLLMQSYIALVLYVVVAEAISLTFLILALKSPT
jgi:MFS family permease